MEKKSFVIDTSVILDSPNNIISLYQNGENELYITDIILKELNKHKEDPQGEKGFYARAFARSLDRGLAKRVNTLKTKKRKGGIKNTPKKQKEDLILGEDIKQSFTCIFDGCDYPIVINIISRKKYQNDSFSNDLKIIEIAKDYNYEIVSNDIYLKLEALARGVEANSMNKDTVQNPEDIYFDTTIILENSDIDDEEKGELLRKELKNLKKWHQVKIEYKDSGKREYFIVKEDAEGLYLNEVDIKKVEKMYKVNPINEEQKFYAEMISSNDFQIGVVTGSTGSGKTLMAVQEGMARVKSKYDPIDGIVYLRNTVTSNDKASELGFRKGDQDQKLGYFAYPLYGALNFIQQRTIPKEKTDLNEQKEKKDSPSYTTYTEQMMADYNIEVMDIAHARGTTITNKWVIFDEVQNSSNATVKLIGTRIGKGSKIILMGDFKQVDHPYLSRNRNGLVYLLQRTKEKGDIMAIQLRKTIRSEIAEWFEENL